MQILILSISQDIFLVVNRNILLKLLKCTVGDLKSISVIETDTATAELIKYMNNCFFATKVSFMNEMKLVSDTCGADWDTAVDGFIRDGRWSFTS